MTRQIQHRHRNLHQQRVLVVDIDSQGNASAALGIQIWQLSAQLKDVLLHKTPLHQV